MATFLGAWALRGYGMWACEKIGDGAFVGCVGIFQPLDWPEPEIAYSLDRRFWRQGFATEAATVARDWLFGHFPLLQSAGNDRPFHSLRRSHGRNLDVAACYFGLMDWSPPGVPGGSDRNCWCRSPAARPG
jgi:hypothetical protein